MARVEVVPWSIESTYFFICAYITNEKVPKFKGTIQIKDLFLLAESIEGFDVRNLLHDGFREDPASVFGDEKIVFDANSDVLLGDI